MSDQPLYYRITDPLESLTIRIRLRKIFGRTVNTSASRDGVSRRRKRDAAGSRKGGKDADDDENNSKMPGSFGPGDEADIRFKWQEKVFGPQELLTIYSSNREKSRHRGDVGAAATARKGALSRLEQDYAGLIDDMRREQRDPLDAFSEVMIFTYTDKDGFVPPSATKSRLTTGDGGVFSHLEEAVVNLPRKAASISFAGAGTNGKGEHGSAHAGLSETAAVMQAHLSREDKFKVMYIMAAVDVGLREAKRVAKSKAAPASGHGGGSGALRWGGEGDEDSSTLRQVHEQLVCSITAHQNGTLEIAPGFSAEEPESGDEGAFLTDHTVKVMDKEGARLTTYRFTSPSGGVFSYTVENDSEPGRGVEEMEKWEAEEAARDMWKKAARQQVAGTQLLGAPLAGCAITLHAFLEIVSAVGFTGVDRLYIEYALSLPRGWKMAGSGDGDDLQYQNAEHDEEYARGGTTQVACQTYPLALPRRVNTSMTGSAAKTVLYRTRSRLEHGSASIKSDSTPSYGNMRMPAMLQPSSTLAPGGAVRRVAAAFLLCFLGLFLALGTSSTFWVALATGAVTVMALGGGGRGGGGGEGDEPTAHFGFPAEFHLVNEDEGELTGIGERPQIFLAVSSLDHLSRHRVEGYGYVSFPRQPGAHELLVRTWRPICSLRSHLQDFFVGGAHRLHDPRYASKPGSFKGSFLSRFGFQTETSGTVRLRLHLAEQGRTPDFQCGHQHQTSENSHRFPSGGFNGNGGRTIDLAGTRTVKEILRVVNAKRMSNEISRRLSATAEQGSGDDGVNNPHAPPTTGADTSTSTAPAAPVARSFPAGFGVRSAANSMGSAFGVSNTPEGGHSSGVTRSDDRGTGAIGGQGWGATPTASSASIIKSRGALNSTISCVLPGSKSVLEGGEKRTIGGKTVESASELLERVRQQLERSEERTKGLGVVGVRGGLAPPG